MFTSTTDALPLKKRALRGRRLVVVDIENVVGGAVLKQDQAVSVRRSLERVAGLNGAEHIVIGVSHCGLLPTGLAWPTARRVVRSGKDGADLALLDVLTQERVEARFDEVVVASGDGIFTEAVAALGRAGLCVTVVARSGHCSKRLHMRSRRTILIDHLDVGFGGAA